MQIRLQKVKDKIILVPTLDNHRKIHVDAVDISYNKKKLKLSKSYLNFTQVILLTYL